MRAADMLTRWRKVGARLLAANPNVFRRFLRRAALKNAKPTMTAGILAAAIDVRECARKLEATAESLVVRLETETDLGVCRHPTFEHAEDGVCECGHELGVCAVCGERGICIADCACDDPECDVGPAAERYAATEGA